MSALTVNSLRLQNFKGIKDFTIEPFGQDITILGENGTGKSTIADSFFYLFFGKDSHDKADFQLKPVTDDGQEIHNLETEVESSLVFNNKPITLKKVFKENWVKTRGSATESFSGHTTKYYIDDVPKKKGEFDKAVAEIININAFKLVTNPLEFNNLHWSGRRQILLDICGDVSDQDVIKSDKKLSKLTAILGDCAIDDHRKKIKESQKKINDDLKEIPARIDELSNSIQSAEKPDQKEKDRLDSMLKDYKDKLQALQTNERLSELHIDLNKINAEIITIQSSADQKQADAKKPLLVIVEKLEAERRAAAGKVKDLEAQIKTDESRNKISSEAKEQKLKDWYEEEARKPGKNNTCPSCGQDLPADQVQAAIEKFNQKKAERLEKITTEGFTLKEGIDKREKDIAAATEEINTLSVTIVEIDKSLEAKNKELSVIYVPVEADDLDKQKDALESQIEALKNGSHVQEENEKRHITETQAEIDEWNKLDAAYKAAESSRKRITELEDQEKKLAKEYEALAEELYLIEQFIVQKVSMLEKNINSKFKLARFKMFKEQINGGIDECCEVLYKGVPFNSGLNSAARVNVGLDIIKTLSEFYDFRAPVFVDNAESINELIPMESQVISLVVSKDQKLTVSKTEAQKAS